MGGKKGNIFAVFNLFSTSDLERNIKRLMRFQSTAELNECGWTAETSACLGIDNINARYDDLCRTFSSSLLQRRLYKVNSSGACVQG